MGFGWHTKFWNVRGFSSGYRWPNVMKKCEMVWMVQLTFKKRSTGVGFLWRVKFVWGVFRQRMEQESLCSWEKGPYIGGGEPLWYLWIWWIHTNIQPLNKFEDLWKKPALPCDWLLNWRTCIMALLGYPGSNATDTWLTGNPTYWKIQGFQLPRQLCNTWKHPLTALN